VSPAWEEAWGALHSDSQYGHHVCGSGVRSSRVGVEHVWAEVKLHVTTGEADGWLTGTGHGASNVPRAIGAEEKRWTRWPGGSDSGTHMQGGWFPSVLCVCANTKHTAITPSSAHSHRRHGCNLALSSGWDRRRLCAAAGFIT
jgi:hypothetical protein